MVRIWSDDDDGAAGGDGKRDARMLDLQPEGAQGTRMSKGRRKNRRSEEWGATIWQECRLGQQRTRRKEPERIRKRRRKGMAAKGTDGRRGKRCREESLHEQCPGRRMLDVRRTTPSA